MKHSWIVLAALISLNGFAFAQDCNKDFDKCKKDPRNMLAGDKCKKERKKCEERNTPPPPPAAAAQVPAPAPAASVVVESKPVQPPADPAAAAPAAPSPTLGQNILKNGGFEEGANGWVLSPLAKNTANFDVSSTEFKSGKNSFHCANGKAWIRSAVTFRPATDYKISFWIKAKDYKGSNEISVMTRYETPGGERGTTANHTFKQGSELKTGAWIFVERDTNTDAIAKGPGHITIYCKTEETAEFWIDDIVVTEVGPHK